MADFSQVWGSNSVDHGYGIATDTLNNVYVGGYAAGSVDGETALGGADILVSKFSPAGVKEWTRQTGTSGGDQVFKVATDSMNNVYVTGVTAGSLHGNTYNGLEDVYVVKYAPNGTHVWTVQRGSTANDRGWDITVDKDDNIVAGDTQGSFDGNTMSGSLVGLVLKWSANSSHQWTEFHVTDGNGVLRFNGVDTDSDGNIYSVGYTTSTIHGKSFCAQSYCGMLIKMTPSGGTDTAFTKIWGEQTVPEDVAVDTYGNIFVVGYTGGNMNGTNAGSEDVFLSRFSPDGTVRDDMQFGTSVQEVAYALVVSPDGFVYISGSTQGSLGGPVNGGNDIFVTRVFPDFVTRETKQWGSPGTDWGYDITMNSNNVTYVSGSSDGQLVPTSLTGYNLVLSNVFWRNCKPGTGKGSLNEPPQNMESGFECPTCPTGTKSDIWNAVNCTICAVGFYSSNSGSTNCTLCPNGSFGNTTQLSSCFQCSPGMFGNNTGQTSEHQACFPCDIGSFSVTHGATNCTICPSGKFGNISGQATESQACFQCSSGSYSSSQGTSSCTKCASGKYGNITGQTSETAACYECSSGQYQSEQGATVCQSCQPGKYGNVTGQSFESSACFSCPAGSYSAAQGSTNCTFCTAGKFGNTSAQSSEPSACFTCPPSTTSFTSGATQCIELNDAPTISVGSAFTVAEDSKNNTVPTSTISDVDVGANDMEVTLSVTNGTLTIINPNGVTFSSDGPINVMYAKFTGTITACNTVLSTLQYTPNNNFNGDDTLKIDVSDMGNTGHGNAEAINGTIAITITAVNDGPMISAGTPLTVAEDSSNNAVGSIVISDVDIGSNPLRVTFYASQGTLSIGNSAGLTYITGNGFSNAFMMFRGTVTSCNNALATAVYTPTSNYNGGDTISIGVSDMGVTGAGGEKTANKTISVTITAVNDGPSISAGTPITVTEDSSNNAVGPIVISDVDIGSNPLRVTFYASQGTLSIGNSAGLTYITGNGFSNAFMIFRGTVTSCNNALATAVYTPTSNYNGGDTISIGVSDMGVTGAGGEKTANKTISVTITAVNDGPSITTPSSFTVAEDSSSQSITGISIADIDAATNPIEITLSVSKGNLNITNINGVSFVNGHFNNIPFTSFTGTITACNNALASLTYSPNTNYNGPDALKIGITDRGNMGTGGEKTSNATLPITITAVNDPPTISIPSPQTVAADTDVTIPAITITDLDISSDLIQVNISVGNGRLSFVNTAPAVTFTQGGYTDNTMISFRSNITNVNKLLMIIVYHGNVKFEGVDTITIRVSDMGHTGAGGPLIVTKQLPINVTYDGPTINTVSNLMGSEDTQLPISGISVVDVNIGDKMLQVNVSVMHGTFSFVNPGIVQFSIGGNNNNNNNNGVSFTGNITNVNKMLMNIIYQGNTHWYGVDKLNITVVDGSTIAMISVTLEIKAINDAPVLTMSTMYSTVEDTDLTFPGISVSDVDIHTNSISVNMTSMNGVLHIQTQTGITFVMGTVSGSNDVKMVGTMSAINGALGNMVFRPSLHFVGNAQVNVWVDDKAMGMSGKDSRFAVVSVSAVNDGPMISPGTPLTVNEDSTNNGIGSIVIADVDVGSNDIRVRISVNKGTMSIGNSGGLTFEIGNGNGMASMVFRGTVTACNNALASTTYTPISNYYGADTINIGVSDMGHGGGMGGELVANATISVTVSPVNDGPSIIPGCGITVNEDSSNNTIPTSVISDIDVGSNEMEITLAVNRGTLNIDNPGGITFSSGNSVNVNHAKFTGTITGCNNALDSLTYTPYPNHAGPDTLKIDVSDMGNVGPVAMVANATISIFVNANACPKGTFGNDTGSTTCYGCPEGTYYDQPGATSISTCISCPMGTYNDQTGQSGCTPCGKGKHYSGTNAISQSTCVSCSAGKYSLSVLATSESTCTQCETGKWGNAPDVECNLCHPGSFNPNKGRSSPSDCKVCPIGKFQNTSGASFCYECSAGTNSNVNNATDISTCVKCPFGKYQGETSSTSCLDCDTDKFCFVGSTDQVSCPVNHIKPPGAVSLDQCVLIPEDNTGGGGGFGTFGSAIVAQQNGRYGSNVSFALPIQSSQTPGVAYFWVPPIGSKVLLMAALNRLPVELTPFTESRTTSEGYAVVHYPLDKNDSSSNLFAQAVNKDDNNKRLELRSTFVSTFESDKREIEINQLLKNQLVWLDVNTPTPRPFKRGDKIRINVDSDVKVLIWVYHRMVFHGKQDKGDNADLGNNVISEDVYEAIPALEKSSTSNPLEYIPFTERNIIQGSFSFVVNDTTAIFVRIKGLENTKTVKISVSLVEDYLPVSVFGALVFLDIVIILFCYHKYQKNIHLDVNFLRYGKLGLAFLDILSDVMSVFVNLETNPLLSLLSGIFVGIPFLFRIWMVTKPGHQTGLRYHYQNTVLPPKSMKNPNTMWRAFVRFLLVVDLENYFLVLPFFDHFKNMKFPDFWQPSEPEDEDEETTETPSFGLADQIGWWKLLSTLFEDIPQLVLQIMILQTAALPDYLAIVTIFSTVLSGLSSLNHLWKLIKHIKDGTARQLFNMEARSAEMKEEIELDNIGAEERSMTPHTMRKTESQMNMQFAGLQRKIEEMEKKQRETTELAEAEKQELQQKLEELEETHQNTANRGVSIVINGGNVSLGGKEGGENAEDEMLNLREKVEALLDGQEQIKGGVKHVNRNISRLDHE